MGEQFLSKTSKSWRQKAAFFLHGEEGDKEEEEVVGTLSMLGSASGLE